MKSNGLKIFGMLLTTIGIGIGAHAAFIVWMIFREPTYDGIFLAKMIILGSPLLLGMIIAGAICWSVGRAREIPPVIHRNLS